MRRPRSRWLVRRSWRDRALDVVLPTDCAHCGRALNVPQAHGVCLACWTTIRPLPGDLCPACVLPGCAEPSAAGDGSGPVPGCRGRSLDVDGMVAATAYAAAARALILRAKLGRRPEILVDLAPWITAVVRRAAWPALDLVVPVPTSPLRTLGRGFDPARVLAGPVSRALSMPLARRVLRRRLGDLRPTKALGAARRETVLADAFTARREVVDGRAILLVDDVVTTGSTVRGCTRALRTAGARSVRVACWARTLL